MSAAAGALLKRGAPASGGPIPFVCVCLVILQHGGDRGGFSGGQLPVRLLRL